MRSTLTTGGAIVAPSLLFIPDISGFTKFVSDTDVEHGRHIIAELLDLIIESDDLGLTVSELEGDAVFFYRHGPLPTFDAVVAQAQRTFEAFHTHLRSYEVRRICGCGACRSAANLSLKIVVHAGPIDSISVRGFEKPYGADVIVAHRLLKNDLPDSEYLLVTEAALAGSDPVAPDWSDLSSGMARIDDVGEVPYRWMSLEPLRAGIPEPGRVPPLEKGARPVAREILVDRAPKEVFELLLSLDRRLSWNQGVDDLEYEPDRVNRVGTRHRCVIDGALIDFETVTNDFGEDRLVYGERILTNPLADDLVSYFIVERAGAGSRVCMEVHYRPKPFPRSLLAPMLRYRMSQVVPRILAALKDAAEGSDADAPSSSDVQLPTAATVGA